VVASDRDAAAVRIPPPLIYAFAIIAGIALHLFAVPFELGLPLAARIGAAAVSGACVSTRAPLAAP
jgi:hypothetical protein